MSSATVDQSFSERARPAAALGRGGEAVRAAGPHGPLPVLLVGLTVVTGLVDAFSYLSLGHVFVANMTGNVVFLAFGLAGSPGFSIPVSAAALIAFALGAAVGGRFAARIGPNRGRLLAGATALEATLLGLAVATAAIGGLDLDPV